MLMNKAETALVNSPPRRWLQRFYETQVLLRFGGRVLPRARASGAAPGTGRSWYSSGSALETWTPWIWTRR